VTDNFEPLIKGDTTAKSPDVSSLMSQMRQDKYYIPDYQRDSSEWRVPKRSLFIESLINNMTIPPLIVYPEADGRNQVVDGQQRLTTIRDFINGQFALAPESDVEYAPNVGPLIQGRKFSELPERIRDQINAYTVNVILLPPNLELDLRLEIFRRINEGGVPLSAHDLRLATFGECETVYFIRLAGIFDTERESAVRMILYGKEKFALDYPWQNSKAWKNWWDQTEHAAGQAASQMFLYYVIARDLGAIQALLASDKTQQALKLKYDRTTVSVLDLYCAQAQQEVKPNTASIVAGMDKLRLWFKDFEAWFNMIKSAKVPSVPANSSTKFAFFIAGAISCWESPMKVSEEQWELIQLFLTQGPAVIQDKLGKEFSSTRGKWPGQKKQIEQTLEICQTIAQK
jgi:hypothetical protein